MTDDLAHPQDVSHLGIGVSDLDRSLAFYVGVLGFRLFDRYGYDVPADPSRSDRPVADGDDTRWRDVALLRVGADDGPVLVLSTPYAGRPTHLLEFDDIGTHHCAFWVTGIEEYVRRIERAGAELAMPLRDFENGRGWGVPSGVTVRSCVVRDPDGTMLQLDERVPASPAP